MTYRTENTNLRTGNEITLVCELVVAGNVHDRTTLHPGLRHAIDAAAVLVDMSRRVYVRRGRHIIATLKG